MSAEALLAKVFDAHGGLARFRATRRIDVRLRIKPWLFVGRFLSPALQTLEAQIDTDGVRAVLTPFPSPDRRGVFEGDEVRIESLDGEVLARLSGARAQAQRRVVWNELHALYFLGYAFWNYSLTPFLFSRPGFTLTELEPWQDGDGRWRRLRVEFPFGLPTHSRVQTFYFDETGLLRRLDYTAEVFSRLAFGAHLVEAPRTFGGLVFPTHRYVVPALRSGRTLPGPTVIEGWVDEVKLIPR